MAADADAVVVVDDVDVAVVVGIVVGDVVVVAVVAEVGRESGSGRE